MSIASFIQEIGRGKDGARSLSRSDAAALMGAVLDGDASDLEVGAFCLAMRMKGETSEELLGFVDAAQARMPSLDGLDTSAPWVVLPSYNGARKLPVLTPLLGALLQREGLNVLLHGLPHDPARVTVLAVCHALYGQDQHQDAINLIAKNDQLAPTCSPKTIRTIETGHLHARLAWLLGVRRVVGVRNSAHSIVKLMNPLAQSAVPPQRVLVVSSYTHPEFYISMGEALAVLPHRAMLLRGTEGEPVADPRRMPRMETFVNGRRSEVQSPQDGSIDHLPEWPNDISAASTAGYIRSVLNGDLPCPRPIARQVACILQAIHSE